MNRDDNIRIAREAGFEGLLPSEHVNGLGAIYSGDEEITEIVERFYALVAAHEREILRRDGWRKCAAGQRTTQFCAMTEEAVKAEREECAKFLESGVDLKGLAGDPQMQAFCGALLMGCAKAIRARGEK